MKHFLIVGLILILAIPVLAGGEGQSDVATLNDYFTSFQARIISYSPNLFRLDSDSSEIKQAFNDALLEVSKFPGATERADTVVMDSSLWYDLPTDFQSMARVAINDPTGAGEYGLDSMLLGDIGQNTVAGTDQPKYYTIWRRQIYFDRNNFLLDSVFLYYTAYSKVLSAGTDTSNVSKIYFNVIVDEAILNFYSGRVGSAVPQILALADRRLVRTYRSMNIEYISITPDVR